jgi:formylglycine-generating enzyme required for sulfatase activity
MVQMKQVISVLTLISFAFFSWSSVTPKPVKVYTITIQQMSADFYVGQANAWKSIVEKDKTNADAWYNYFKATRYARFFDQSQSWDEKPIAKEAFKHIPNTFEGQYMMAWTTHGDKEKKRQYLEKAYEYDDNRQEIVHDYLSIHIKKGNEEKCVEFANKLYNSGELSNGVLSWNYNVLQSVEDNGILFTWGDNDTYPAWILQYAKNIRKDVKVLNAHLILDEKYRTKVLKDLGMPALKTDASGNSELQQAVVQHFIKHCKRPLYVNVTTHPSFRKPIEENLHLTGLAYKYSKKDFDNIAVLKNNVENKFALDYIKLGLGYDLSESIVNQTNMSFLPSFILLYKHYKESNEQKKADEIKDMMLKIGKANNRLEHINKYFGSNDAEIRKYPQLNIKKLERKFQKVGEAFYASSTELSVADYDQFLMDLVKNREFDKLAICKIGKTNWRSFLKDAHKDLPDGILYYHGRPEDANMPIQNISHEAAKLYCEWLTNVYNTSTYKKKKYKKVVFRLPTTKEWETAALGGHMEVPYPWGGYYHKNAKGCYLSNFDVASDEPCKDCKDNHPSNDGGFFTVHLDAYYPNDFGCYNMSGNVAEMVATKGIAKGGSWEDTPENCKISAVKNYNTPSPAIGFRVFMEVK